MSVITDVQDALKGLNGEFRLNLARSATKEERVAALLYYAIRLHGLFIKVRPFERELSTTRVWSIISQGEAFAQAAVPPSAEVIITSMKLAYNLSASPLTASEDNDTWARVQQYIEELSQNLEENWDDAVEMIERYEKEAADFYNDMFDQIREGFEQNDPKQ